MKYFGVTSDDPYERQDELRAEGRLLQNFEIIKCGLGYFEAQELEERCASIYRRCEKSESHPGGQRKAGNVHSVYSYDSTDPDFL